MKKFRSVFFGELDPEKDSYEAFPVGEMDMPHVVRLINDVSEVTDVAGRGIT
ncbi:hypothetical protein [Nitrosomonas ureae]|uniref:hypothetical protein n=1 Tax=Nitrosomonas ureae TaxID=44577 RepID=UPI000AFE9822|nr:hypothetical protein [Nitrosomonas ureae]